MRCGYIDVPGSGCSTRDALHQSPDRAPISCCRAEPCLMTIDQFPRQPNAQHHPVRRVRRPLHLQHCSRPRSFLGEYEWIQNWGWVFPDIPSRDIETGEPNWSCLAPASLHLVYKPSQVYLVPPQLATQYEFRILRDGQPIRLRRFPNQL